MTDCLRRVQALLIEGRLTAIAEIHTNHRQQLLFPEKWNPLAVALCSLPLSTVGLSLSLPILGVSGVSACLCLRVCVSSFGCAGVRAAFGRRGAKDRRNPSVFRTHKERLILHLGWFLCSACFASVGSSGTAFKCAFCVERAVSFRVCLRRRSRRTQVRVASLRRGERNFRRRQRHTASATPPLSLPHRRASGVCSLHFLVFSIHFFSVSLSLSSLQYFFCVGFVDRSVRFCEGRKQFGVQSPKTPRQTPSRETNPPNVLRGDARVDMSLAGVFPPILLPQPPHHSGSQRERAHPSLSRKRGVSPLFKPFPLGSDSVRFVAAVNRESGVFSYLCLKVCFPLLLGPLQANLEARMHALALLEARKTT